MSYRYRVKLSPRLDHYQFGNTINVPSIADAKDGFWINGDNEFTRDEDAVFWIPPASILFVEKIAMYEIPTRQNRYD